MTVFVSLLGGSSYTVAILLAVFIIFITSVFWFYRGSVRKGKSVLLTGLCEAGKTLIFARLVYNKYFDTYTSISDNSGLYLTKSEKPKSLRLVDIPGEDRLRLKFLENHKANARAVVFVVDSLTIQKELKDVAGLLYTILSDKLLTRVPVLVACNKQDHTMAKGMKPIQMLLEKEFNVLRVTRSASLDGANSAIFLGRKNKDFEFGDLNVEFIECSAQGQEPELTFVEKWLTAIA